MAAQVLRATDQAEAAGRALADGLRWVHTTHASHVPAPFQDSFLTRNSVNQALVSLGATQLLDH